MLLDIVLDDRDVLWLGTESDKARYFEERLAQFRLTPRELPHLTFGSGSNQILRRFADKLPTLEVTQSTWLRATAGTGLAELTNCNPS